MATAYEGRKMSRKEKRRLRRASFRHLDCERKVPYPTEGAAKHAIWKNRRNWSTRMNAYQCPHSLVDGDPHWHIGRATPK